MLPKWAWFKFSITNIRKNFNFLCKQKTLSFEFYIEAKILHTENESLSSIPEMLAGILLSSHRKHNELVVECARIFYQVVKFVRIAIHYHLCLLKKHGYDNVFNFSHSDFLQSCYSWWNSFNKFIFFKLEGFKKWQLPTSFIFVILKFP